MAITPSTHLSRLTLAVTSRRDELAGRNGRGAVMSEYGILIFFVGIAAFSILVLFGGEVWELFTTGESEFDSSRKNPAPYD